MAETYKKVQTQGGGETDLVELSGCTGSVLLVQEDYLVVANVGDSPVYVFKDISKDEFTKGSPHEVRFKVEQLSVDHKPDQPEETERIIATGGILDQFQSAATGKKIGPMRVWTKESR